MDYEALQYHVSRNVIRIVEQSGQLQIHGRHRTGVLILPSGRRIVLRTKLAGVTLLDWLVYLGEFPDFQAWNQLGNVTLDDDWQHLLAKLFLAELEIVTRWHLRKDFVKLNIESPLVRGRIQAGKLAQHLWRMPRLPQVVRGRSYDTPANRMLAAALGQVVFLMSKLDTESSKLFYRLRSEWAQIAGEEIDRQRVIVDGFAAAPSGYANALQLARLILIGAAMDPQSGWGGQSFTLSLAGIWERALRKMCSELSSTTGWRLAPAAKRVRAWDDATGENDPSRLMIADILLQRGSQRWVLDAKYKRDFGSESRSDRFQMCAYALGFQAGRATLIYPYSDDWSTNPRQLLHTQYGSQSLVIDAMALGMESGPCICRQELLTLLTSANQQ